jgi:hypothetical protein
VKTRDALTVSEALTDQGQRKCGLLFVKENVNTDKFLIDREDNSIMRTVKHFDCLFEEAGFQTLKQFYHKNFPEELYAIHCWVLCKI